MRIPNSQEQYEWMTSAYQKMHALDFKGLAKQVNDTINPVARKRVRQEEFCRAFQNAFDKEFREQIPEIDRELEWNPDFLLGEVYKTAIDLYGMKGKLKNSDKLKIGMDDSDHITSYLGPGAASA